VCKNIARMIIANSRKRAFLLNLIMTEIYGRYRLTGGAWKGKLKSDYPVRSVIFFVENCNERTFFSYFCLGDMIMIMINIMNVNLYSVLS